ncbi:hypothetical protein BCU43_018270 [Vibrio lentus]|nr:hypothetical protein [Vibrio lentus]
MIDDGGNKDIAFEKARVQLEESGIKVTAASLTVRSIKHLSITNSSMRLA